jgi:hypothetical protein
MMRVIIIEDKDARALIDSLKLETMNERNILRKDPEAPCTAAEMQRAFNYVVVRWLQDQGCNIIRGS